MIPENKMQVVLKETERTMVEIDETGRVVDIPDSIKELVDDISNLCEDKDFVLDCLFRGDSRATEAILSLQSNLELFTKKYSIDSSPTS